MIKNILLVRIGGFIGSILRYIISVIMLPIVAATGFPIATLSVNICGSLIIGSILGLCSASQSLYYLLIVGLCGGFTTFSSFSLETLNLFRSGNATGAISYILLSVICGLIAVWLGFYMGTKLN